MYMAHVEIRFKSTLMTLLLFVFNGFRLERNGVLLTLFLTLNILFTK